VVGEGSERVEDQSSRQRLETAEVNQKRLLPRKGRPPQKAAATKECRSRVNGRLLSRSVGDCAQSFGAGFCSDVALGHS
jgi:hypothetical protein